MVCGQILRQKRSLGKEGASLLWKEATYVSRFSHPLQVNRAGAEKEEVRELLADTYSGLQFYASVAGVLGRLVSPPR